MGVSVPLLVFGLSLTAVGAAVLFLSFSRDRVEDVEQRGAAVVFFGPIPIVFGGKGRWALIGVAVAAAIALLLLVASMHPELVGW